MYDTHICKKICDMLCSILLPYYNRLVEKHFLSILIHKKYSLHLKIFSPQKTTHLFLSIMANSNYQSMDKRSVLSKAFCFRVMAEIQSKTKKAD